MNKLKLGFVSLFIGVSLMGTNLMAAAINEGSNTGSFFGFFGAAMLIVMALWDFADHYAEIHTKARMNDEQSR